MESGNLGVIRRWFEEVWNQGREETIDELFAADGVAHGLDEGAVTSRGPEEFKQFARTLRGAIPDVHIGIEDAVASGDKVAVRIVLEGTHRGDGLGVKASGRPVRVAGIVLVRIVNGQIAEGWNSWDQLGLLKQIGALGEPRADRFMAVKAQE